jgi:hypothetical protein
MSIYQHHALIETSYGSLSPSRLEKLRQGTLLCRFFATSRQRLREVAERLGLKRVPNLGGCPAS